MFCPNCGTENEDQAIYCGNCGINMKSYSQVSNQSSQSKYSKPANNYYAPQNNYPPPNQQNYNSQNYVNPNQNYSSNQYNSQYGQQNNYQQPNGQNNFMQGGYNQAYPQDYISPVVLILSFFIPIIGIVAWIIYHNSAPKSARNVGIAALVGVLFYVFFLNPTINF